MANEPLQQQTCRLLDTAVGLRQIQGQDGTVMRSACAGRRGYQRGPRGPGRGELGARIVEHAPEAQALADFAT